MRLIFFDQPFIRKTVIAIVADDDMIQNSDLHDGAGKNQISGYFRIALEGSGSPEG